MRILAIDSSSFSASAAIVENEKIIAEFFINTGFTHSQTLMPMIKNVLDISGTKLADIDLVAVTKGPGSFTGVRIGVASAKGIAMPQDVPCVGISALEAIAYNFVSAEDRMICACMDARCGQVYNALFKISGGKVVRLTDDRTIMINDLEPEIQKLEGSVCLAGDGAALCAGQWRNSRAELAPEGLRYPRGSPVAFAAEKYFDEGKAVPAGELQPLYLQLPQAQRELNAKKTQNHET